MSSSDIIKRCPQCDTIKTASNFGRRTVKSRHDPNVRYDTLTSWCKACHAALKRRKRAADPHARQKEREYENRPDIKLRDRERRIARAYGLPPNELAILKTRQGNRCAICTKPLPAKFHVDHCHATGQVRGLLCPPCNVAIAQLGDNTKGIMRAIRYLQQFD